MNASTPATTPYQQALELVKRGRHAEAIPFFEQTLNQEPGHFHARNNLGVCLNAMKLYQRALAEFEMAISLKPAFAEAYVNAGNANATLGRFEEAEVRYRSALALDRNQAIAYHGLANLKRFESERDPLIGEIQGVVADAGLEESQKAPLYFSLGKIFDDLGQFEEAAESYIQGNRIKGASRRFDPREVEERVDALIRQFDQPLPETNTSSSETTPRPLFIVGMPRSGTTLLAQRLSAHPNVDNAGELSAIWALTQKAPQPLDAMAIERMRHVYLKRLVRDVGFDAAFVIDKFPLNFFHLGFIRALFPEAKILHCSRDPLDTCLSNYFQMFSGVYDYSFELASTARFYNQYRRLMSHWETIGLEFLEVAYEDLVMSEGQNLDKVLRWLGLSPSNLDSSQETTVIDTASRWQARQSTYLTSMERWRHYPAFAAELRSALAE